MTKDARPSRGCGSKVEVLSVDIGVETVNSDVGRKVEAIADSFRAFDLLATRPVSLVGVPQAERDVLVVTAVADANGNEHVVSRFGDPTWDMSPEALAKNRKPSALTISWPKDVPQDLVNDSKAALYCAFQRMGVNDRRLSGSAVAKIGSDAVRLVRHLASVGLTNFSQVRPLHLSDHVSDLLQRMKPHTARCRVAIIDLIWTHDSEVFYPLPEHPWGGRSANLLCGCAEDDSPSGRTGRTPVIPPSVQRILFSYCEARLNEAENLIHARDAGEITAFSYQITAVRDAILYLVQIASGMRNSECTGIVRGAWRTETRNGTLFHWVRTQEIKTRRGPVEYLVPPEALRALQILERLAEPLQARLADEARWLEDEVRRCASQGDRLPNGMTLAEAVQRLNHIREIVDRLFLTIGKRTADHIGRSSRVELMTVDTCVQQLKKLAQLAGTDWDLANHQCRRTFAYNVANSRLGRMGLVFLKWQLKHSSLSWTQLYASNPLQDQALYREFEDELVEARQSLLEGWCDPSARLSGGAGRKLMQTRGIPVRDLKRLLQLTAESIELRSTGHAWCISGARVCQGQGVYDPTLCGGCSQSIIDGDQAATWQLIHLENLRLAAVTDCGQAVVDKATRAIERSTRVLEELGVPLPTEQQAMAYGVGRRIQ